MSHASVEKLELQIRAKEQRLVELHAQPDLVDRRSYLVQHLVLYAMTMTYLGGLMLFCGTDEEKTLVQHFVVLISLVTSMVTITGVVYTLLADLKAQRDNVLWLKRIEDQDGNIRPLKDTSAYERRHKMMQRLWATIAFMLVCCGQP